MGQTLVGSGLLFAGGLVKHWPFLCILVHLEKERVESISLCWLTHWSYLPPDHNQRTVVRSSLPSPSYLALPLPSPSLAFLPSLPPFLPSLPPSLSFPPSLLSYITSPPHNVVCTHSIIIVCMPTSAAIVPCFQAFWKAEARTDRFDRFLLRDPV